MKPFPVYCDRLRDGNLSDALKVSLVASKGLYVLGTIEAPDGTERRMRETMPGAWLVVPTSDPAAPYPAAVWLPADDAVVRAIAGDYRLSWKAGE